MPRQLISSEARAGEVRRVRRIVAILPVLWLCWGAARGPMAQDCRVEEGHGQEPAAQRAVEKEAIGETAEVDAPGEFGETLTVTARKVEEDVQEIPLSVQVLSSDYLDEADMTRLYELQFNVPGLVVNNLGRHGAGFSLRGIGGTGGSVATYLNGVYLGRSNLAMARMFDLERIEVLKGPQGTLYGRNATGGSINLITRSPQNTFSANIETSYGTFATARMQGHVNLPLKEAAVRLAFIASESDGYIRNAVDDRRFGENDFWGLRGSVRVYATDPLLFDLTIQHVSDDGANGELWTPRPDFLVDPGDIRLTTVTLENPHLKTENDNVSVNLEYDLGFGSLRSIAGYARNEVRNLDDCAGLPLLQGCVRGARPATFDQLSLEIQLLLHGTGLIDGLVGAHYFDADSASDVHQLLPLVNPRPLNNSHSTEREQTAAIFGQANLRLSQRWSLTGGLRLSSEEQRVTTIGTGVQDSPTRLVDEKDSDEVSWRLDLKYAVTDDLLVYTGVSTGYNSGGVITAPLRNGQPDTFGPEYLTAYEAGGKSEWLNRRLTLNAAAFYYDFDDLQVQTVTFSGDNLVNEVDNAARAELYGIEAEGVFQILGRLALSGGLVWVPKREFVEFRNDATGDTLSGNKLVRAPEWSATVAVGGEHPLPALGRLAGRLEFNYRGGFFYTKENDPLFAQSGFGLLNAFLRLESASGGWYIFASGRNLTDEDYFTQVFLQSSPGYPDTYEGGVGYRF